MISDVSSTNQELLRKYKREMNLRKKCHNELVRLKGPTPELLRLVAMAAVGSVRSSRYHLDLTTPRPSSVCVPGNIRVFCRVRPVSQEEGDSADARTLLSFDSDDDAVLYLSNKGKVMTFELDKVFPPQASQEEVSGTRTRTWFCSPGSEFTPHLCVCSLIGPSGVPGGPGFGHFLHRRL